MRRCKLDLRAFVALAAVLALCAVGTPSSFADGPTVALGSPVSGSFYTGSTGYFPPAIPGDPVFSQDFTVANFDPGTGGEICDPAVDQSTRPFTDVDPLSGICTQATDGVNSAGVGSLSTFLATYTTSFTISGPGSITFSIESDDGWVIGVGPGGPGQPTFSPSNPMIGVEAFGGITPLEAYPIAAAYNRPTAPSVQSVEVTFPDAGTYPVEFDYAECCSGQLTFTLQANGSVVEPVQGADLSTSQAGAPASAPGGTQVAYSVTATNAGPADATGVVVSDTLPAGSTFIPESSTSGCTQATQTDPVLCSVGALASGTSTVVVVTAMLPCLAGDVSNGATVSGNESDPNPGNNASSSATSLSTPCEGTSGSFDNGGTLTTDPNHQGPNGTNVFETMSQTIPAGVSGDASIVLSSAESCPTFATLVATTTSPVASQENPLVLVFRYDACSIPPGTKIKKTHMFKSTDGINYVEVPNCEDDLSHTGREADPDPCLLKRKKLRDGDFQYTVLWSGSGDPGWRPS